MIFSIFCRPDAYSQSIGSQIAQSLIEDHGWIRNDDMPQLVISIGGDGTLLRAIHTYLDHLDRILFVGIHTGTLGFFTDYTRNEVREFIADLTSKQYSVQSYPLLECRDSQGKIYYALNEFRVGSFAKTVRFDIYVDNEYFESTAGGGVCIASQPGSTGVNRALNGAVVEDGLNVLELTQIMPVAHKSQHFLSVPYIMRPEREIVISGESFSDSILSYDYLETERLQGITRLKISSSSRMVRFARFRPYSYLKRLKNLY